MRRTFRRVVVLGAGLMGSQIAAHLANVGIPSYLLDMVPREPSGEEKTLGLGLDDARVRNRFALAALKRLKAMRPSPLYIEDVLRLITPGNFEDNLGWVAEADWVVEAVIESLTVKRDLWQRVEAAWRPGTVLSSNTSGIPIASIAAGRSPEFRRHFLGTHFFNPPRYLKLLEVIPTPETDPGLVSEFVEFGERVLGKGVVLAKDTPNFIANRIGTYGLMVTLEAMKEAGLGFDEVDALTGPVMGRPKSATFRTLDLVGLDTFVHVAGNTGEAVAEAWEKRAFEVPAYIREMVQRGWLGDKSGQGFFKAVKGGEGREILVLDPASMEYRPRQKAVFASLEAARNIPDPKARMRALVYADDRAGRFVWTVTKKVLLYAAAKLGEIADDITGVDRAMRWGFNWDYGPFETWDLLGVRRSVERMEQEGEVIPPFVRALLNAGKDRFYAEAPRIADQGPRTVSLARLKAQNHVIKATPGATLLDLGDEVACLELHSPKEAIGADIINMIHWSVQEVPKNHRGLVLTSQAPNFCVGANLFLLLMEIQDEEWDEAELIVRRFQDANQALRRMERPVVVAPYGLTLGGGTEMCYAADRVQASAETYMGLVEVGVGLIPGGGGTKETLLRLTEGIPSAPSQLAGPVDLQPFVNRAFELIGTAKVATSAREAQALGYLRPSDGVSVNGDHLIHDAKQTLLALDAAGYRPAPPRQIPVTGPGGRAVLELGLYNMKQSGYASDHDVLIGKKLAFVLTGGNVPAGTLVTEQYLLDLEREAFLSLCGEPKTQARMQYMLAKGKPLRN